MKLLLLASGTGSLAQAVIDAGFDIAAVVSDIPGAQVLERATAANIATKVIEFKKPREAWDSELIEFVESVNPDLVVSVGFMRILSAEFVSKFKVINSHPALLPNFPGAHAVRDALAAKVSQTGCTVHWVDAGVDTGEVIAQVAVDVLPADNEASLHERIKIVERKLIVETIRNYQESGEPN
jgi:phosphoribosylglycinamide formyltransferase-1